MRIYVNVQYIYGHAHSLNVKSQNKVSNKIYLLEGFPHVVWAGVVGRVPQSLQGTIDGLTILGLKVSFIGSFRGLGGYCRKVLQHP